MKHHQANGKGFGAEFSHFKARGQGTKRTTNFCYICPPPSPNYSDLDTSLLNMDSMCLCSGI